MKTQFYGATKKFSKMRSKMRSVCVFTLQLFAFNLIIFQNVYSVSFLNHYFTNKVLTLFTHTNTLEKGKEQNSKQRACVLNFQGKNDGSAKANEYCDAISHSKRIPRTEINRPEYKPTMNLCIYNFRYYGMGVIGASVAHFCHDSR